MGPIENLSFPNVVLVGHPFLTDLRCSIVSFKYCWPVGLFGIFALVGITGVLASLATVG